MTPKLKDFEKRYKVGKGHMTFSYSAGFERPFDSFFHSDLATLLSSIKKHT